MRGFQIQIKIRVSFLKQIKSSLNARCSVIQPHFNPPGSSFLPTCENYLFNDRIGEKMFLCWSKIHCRVRWAEDDEQRNWFYRKGWTLAREKNQITLLLNKTLPFWENGRDYLGLHLVTKLIRRREDLGSGWLSWAGGSDWSITLYFHCAVINQSDVEKVQKTFGVFFQ